MKINKTIEDYGKVVYEGPLIKKKKKKEEFQKIYYYRLTDKGVMVQFKNKDSAPQKSMDIKNCRINKGKFKNQEGDYFYGVNIIGRKENQDFYSLNEKDIEEWYEAFTMFCVLLDLNQRYKRLNKIGKGNFATVYKYERNSDKKVFAVKSLDKRKIIESKRGSNDNPLLNEIEVMRTCDHPNIIKLFEVHEAEKHVHLVMEVLEGGELFNRIRNKGTYTEADAIKIMKNILEAMAYLHERRIVHRDLKPENLILANPDDDYDVKIADFGLASFVPEGEKLELACGSPGYVSYELLQDPPPGYDCKADIFSVGVILYILLTGRPAFPGADYKQIFEKNKKGEPNYPRRYWNKISEAGQNLVKSMIEKDQNVRLSAEECLRHEWFGVQGGSEVLGDAVDGMKDILDLEVTPNTSGADGANPLQTTTPVMAGRKLKDTCESPWNPSGMTPKQVPATPMLRDGFDGQPRRMDVNKLFGGQVMKKEEEKKKEPAKENMDTLKKFDIMQKDRKTKTKQNTMNFGNSGLTNHLAKKKEEENKDQEAIPNQGMPQMREKEGRDPTKSGGILDKILNENQKSKEEIKESKYSKDQKDQKDQNDQNDQKEMSHTPETSPNKPTLKPTFNTSDSMVNIKDEELKECPGDLVEDRMLNIKFQSFKPGVSVDARVIPTTPGDCLQSVSTKNKPRVIKNNLMSAI